jgi:uncharacterized C2H2 Zn-finger protein
MTQKRSILSSGVTHRKTQKRDIEETSDLSKGDGKKILRCAVCQTDFSASRSHARFCSDSCRKAHSRRKDTFRREAKKMLNAIHNVRRLYALWPDLEEFMLEQMRGAIEM